ncbi:hypothetical protein [uncultured Cohaesibacter sp.]|uniref:hypothetical protein n=1 Tax=uncultured Cohaesibacter sp. TaxID=1002546 RepID=UPI0029C77D36|nr:hypothetical protein [uncultured Cohaesibacter sp.]
MRSEARLQRDNAYNERLKALRSGALDADIFRMMATDVPRDIIAHRLDLYPSHFGFYVDRILNAFRRPDDSVKPFPWERRLAR